MDTSWAPAKGDRELISLAISKVINNRTFVDKEDLRQVALLALWEARNQEGIENPGLRYVVVHRAIIDALRKVSGRYFQKYEEVKLDAEENWTHQVDIADPQTWLEAKQLYAAISSLPSSLKDTITAKMETDKPKEAAELLGIGEDALFWRLREIRKRIEAYFSHEVAKIAHEYEIEDEISKLPISKDPQLWGHLRWG